MKCIEHNQKGNKAGYGNGYWEGTQIMLHRLSYCFYKQIPISAIKGAVIMHTCDNPRCVNPLHLKLGTQDENLKDMVGKGRSSKGEAHYITKLTEEQIQYAKQNYKPRDKQYSCHALAARFGVAPSTMHNAITGKRWGHLNG